MRFNRKRQAKNCDRLVEKLETLPDRCYYQHCFMNPMDGGWRGCALGWAAYYNIGGLFLDGSRPMLMFHDFEGKAVIEADSPTAAEMVFGRGTFLKIFGGLSDPGEVYYDSGAQKRRAIELLKSQSSKLRTPAPIRWFRNLLDLVL